MKRLIGSADPGKPPPLATPARRTLCGLRRYWKRALVLVAMLVLAACASSPERLPESLAARDAALLAELDAAIVRAGVRDAACWPLPGYPYLRSNRFWVSMGELLPDQAASHTWLEAMRQLDRETRAREIENLPAASLARLASDRGTPAARQELQAAVRSAGDRLLERERMRPGMLAAVRTAAEVPSEHSNLRRAAGLYPLAALPVLYLTHRSRQRFQQWFNQPVESLPRLGQLESYAPENPTAYDATATAELIREARRNPLGVPWLSPAQQATLAAALAPVLQLDRAGEHDRPGAIVWREGRIAVDVARPTLYYYISYAFWRSEPALQINYALWFSGRRGPQAPLIERGELDGLTLRVTLDSQGQPILVDGMNSCGCYHFAAPAPGVQPLPTPWALDLFVPQQLPPDYPGQRLALRVNSGWHQVQRLLTAPQALAPQRYRLEPYERLESLPRAGGEHESMFDARGVAKNSQRYEYLLLFPMGIADVGSMRQRGNHPIELVGSAHFDDPQLIDQRFTPASH